MFIAFSPFIRDTPVMDGKKDTIRIPQQRRSRETKARILKSAEYLFSKKGFYKTNSKEISVRAGVAVGNFYAYFRDKKAVLMELLEEHNQKVFQSIILFQGSMDMKGEDPKSFFTSVIENVVKAHDHLPDFHKDIAFLIHSDSEVMLVMDRFKRIALKKVMDMLLQFKDRLRISDLEAAAILLTRTV
jgi:AcrR family transcriptional regulator